MIARSLLALSLLAVPAVAFADAWTIDGAHSSANFKVRHLMVTNVTGTFGAPTGQIDIDDKDITKSTITAEVDASKVDTGIAKRDEHLRSADFFDVAKHPKLTFKSKKVVKAGDGLKVTGDLTIHGVTKEVTFDVDGPTAPIKGMQGNYVRGVSATAKINRKDFGLTWNKALEGGGVLVGEDVTLNIDLELHSDKKPAH
jgi:polyisoprenoid-binding protein YceI